MLNKRHPFSIKTKMVIVVSIFCIIPVIFNIIYVPNNGELSLYGSLLQSNMEYLNPGDDHVEYIGYITYSDQVYWSVDFTPNIEVRAVRESEYIGGYPSSYSYYIVSSGSIKSDYWSPYNSDYYYFIYVNIGSGGDTLIHSETIYYGYNYGYNNILMPIIAISIVSTIVFAIIIIAVVVAIRNNSRTPRMRPYRPRPYQTRAPPPQTILSPQHGPVSQNQKQETQKIKPTFCRFCGDKTTSDATFCPNCGSKL